MRNVISILITVFCLVACTKKDATAVQAAADKYLANSRVTVKDATVLVGQTTTFSISLIDATGKQVQDSTVHPALSLDNGTSAGVIAPLALDANGNYSAVFTGTWPGSAADVIGVIDGKPVAQTPPQVTVVAAPISYSLSTITASATTVQAGNTVTVAVIPRNVAGNQVSGNGHSVVFTLNGGTSQGTFGSYSIGSDGSLLAIFTGTVAGTLGTVAATVDGNPITSPAPTIQVTPGPAASTTSWISGTGPVTADGSSLSTISITLQDAYQNPIVGVTPTFSATDSGSTNVYGACSLSDASGQSTCSLKSTHAEVKTLRLLTPVAMNGGSVAFVAGAPVAGHSNITGTGPVAADGSTASTITVSLGDANGNPVSGLTPTFSATDTGSTNGYGACSVSSAAGISTCTLTSTKAETKTLSLVTPVSKVGGTVVFSSAAASSANSSISGSGPVVADGVATSTISIVLQDTSHNPLVGVTPTFSATNTGSGNTYGACSVSDASGNSTCTLKSTKAETKTLSLVSPIAKTGGTVSFVAGPANAAGSQITGTSPVTADGTSASTITITIGDAQGNPISGVTPTFSATNTGSSNVYGACSSTNASGISTCSLRSLKAEAKVLSLTAPVSKVGDTVNFTAGPASAVGSTIVGTTPMVADGVSTSTITVTLVDVNGNTVPGVTPTFSATDTGATNHYTACTLTNSSGVATCSFTTTKAEAKTITLLTPVFKIGNTVTATSGGASATQTLILGTSPVIANGSATSTITITMADANANPVVGTVPTFSATDTGSTNVYGACSASNSLGISLCTLSSTKAEIKTLSVVTPVAKSGGSVIFIPGSPVAANSSIVVVGATVADGTSLATVNVTLLDGFLNAVVGVLPTFSATDTGSTNVYGACSTTNSSGVATCTLKSSKAETKVLSLLTPVSKIGGNAVFTAGSASALLSSISGTGPIVSDGSTASAVTITLVDSFSNPVVGVVPTFSATDTSGTNIYNACSASNASGVSSCSFTTKKAELKTLSIATPVVKVGGTVAVSPGAANAAASSITGTGPVVANGVLFSVITITIADSYFNPISGVTPTFSATDTASGNSYGACTATNASGVSTCSLSSAKAEVKTLSILTPVSKAGGTVTFTAGSASIVNSSISGSGPVVANTTSTSTISIYLGDSMNNPIAGVVPTFGATDSGLNNAYGTCSATNASGNSTCTLSSGKAETKTLALITPVVKTGGTVVFSPGAANGTNSTILGTSPTIADGSSTSTITVTLADAFGNLISGSTPTFSATNTGNTNVYSACSASVLGISACSLSSTKAESKTLSLLTPVSKTGGTVLFIAGLPTVGQSSITAAASVTADGTAAAAVTVNLKDANSNPVSGVLPTFSATDTGTTNVYVACSTSDSSGNSSCGLKSRKAEVKTLSIATPISLSGGTVSFLAGAVNGAHSTLTGTGSVIADGVATSTVSMVLKDVNDNPLIGVTPSFSATDTGAGNLYGACSATTSAGASSCLLKSTKAEVKTLSLTSPGSFTGGTVSFIAGAASALTSTITGVGGNAANGVATGAVTVNLQDANHNVISGVTPVFSASGTGNAYNSCSSSNASGNSSCTMTSTVAEAKTLSLTSPVSVTGGSLSFRAALNDLEVPIELVDYSVSSNAGTTIFERTRTSLNTADYDGTVMYDFEIVAGNASTGSQTVDLVDASGTPISSSITIPALTAVPTRLRTAITPTSGSSNYRLRLSGTTVGGLVTVYTARILVKQIGATKTRVYIPMVNRLITDTTGSDGFTGADSTSSTTYTQALAGVYSLWTKTAGNWGAGSVSYSFEAVLQSSNASGTAYASLFNATTSSQVTGAEVSVTGTTVQMVSVSFADNATNFTAGNDFEVRVHSSNGLYAANLGRAGLWISLTNLYKGEVYYRVDRYRNLLASLLAQQGRIVLTTSNFSNGAVYLEATGNQSSASGAGYALYDDGINVASPGSPALVSGASLLFGTAKSRVRTAAVSVTNGDNFLGQYVYSLGSGSLSNGLVVANWLGR